MMSGVRVDFCHAMIIDCYEWICIKMVLCDGQEVAISTVDGWCLCQKSGACAMKWAGHSMPGQRNHATGGR